MWSRLLAIAAWMYMMCLGQGVYAQTEPQYSQYMYQGFMINPAAAGADDKMSIDVLHRSQYVGVADQSISTQFIGFNTPIPAWHSGVGIAIVNDNIGFTRSTAVNLNYAYRKQIKKVTLSLGVGAGLLQTGLSGDQLRTPDGVYINGINHRDDLVPTGLIGSFSPDLASGIYLKTPRLHAGVSINHLYSFAKYKTGTQSATIQYPRTLVLTAGYDIAISKRWILSPSVLMKTDFVKLQLDWSLTTRIYDNIMTGISLRGYEARSLDAVAIYAGVEYKRVRLIYAYDVNISYLKGFNSGSHELSLRYQWPLKTKERKLYFYHNSRYL
jgi:type IX secretion system PorP/SprF family membrane protein